MNSRQKRFPVWFRLTLTLAVALVWLAGGQVAEAQTDDEVNAAIQFNFVNPGARSLGLGGAFVGLADDATAAYTNPAGIVQIRSPEVSAEARGWRYTHRYADSGHVNGTPTMVGVDTVSGLRVSEASNDVVGLSYLSVVYPVGERWSLAAYRHHLANFEASFSTQGVFVGDLNELVRIRPVTTDLDLSVINYGGAAAFELIPDRLSIGLGFAWSDFNLDARTDRFAFDNPDFVGPGGFFGPRADDGTVINYQIQEGNDSAVSGNVGVLWKPNKNWQIGAVYRRGPEFDFEALFFLAPSELIETQTATFRLPDVAGIGVAYLGKERWKVVFDYNHVEYSVLTEDFVTFFDVPDPESYTVSDGNEYHLGIEYWLRQGRPDVYLRLGGWQEPEHQVQYEGVDPVQQTLWGIGNDEAHLTVGFGLVFGGGKLEINGAADFSDRVDTVSLSGVWRFGKL